ncbi:hypothetical protein PG985_005344 [Apiospora marii]|uniref:Uncharacterized protein n=1 Tax=Apiospora marii TaxID=335849 RepID=A0ABR1SBV6_9PEZI
MLINNIIPIVATAAAVFAPATAAWDMKLKWHSKTTCSGGGGPSRTYSRNNCIALASTDHGVQVQDHTNGCKMRGYPGGNCDGGSKTAFSSHQCHSLKGIWSVRIEC